MYVSVFTASYGLQVATTIYDLRRHYKLQRCFWAHLSARFTVCFQFDLGCGAANDASVECKGLLLQAGEFAVQLCCPHSLGDLWLVLLHPATGVDCYIVDWWFLCILTAVVFSRIYRTLNAGSACRGSENSVHVVRTAWTIKPTNFMGSCLMMNVCFSPVHGFSLVRKWGH